MDKKTFKSSFQTFLEEPIDGINSEQKIKYMKKWRGYENNKIP
ncbi:hypothetical protein [Bacillus sp. T33-2]|nr:hypothetical protein [Bacillus sp. T33-2]